jgi:ABC-type glycerol-3-phosphate transport system substrate-binding protein
MNKTLMISLIAAASVLAACGGSSDEAVVVAPKPTGEVPASASATSAGLVAYLTEWSLGVADTQSQVSIASFAPPTPEDTLPDALK